MGTPNQRPLRAGRRHENPLSDGKSLNKKLIRIYPA